jgi:hypothetical protein
LALCFDLLTIDDFVNLLDTIRAQIFRPPSSEGVVATPPGIPGGDNPFVPDGLLQSGDRESEFWVGRVAPRLDGAARAAAVFKDDAPGLRLQPVSAARLVADETASSRTLERIFALRLDLAELDGIVDDWIGVAAGATNPARDLVRAILNRVV